MSYGAFIRVLALGLVLGTAGSQAATKTWIAEPQGLRHVDSESGRISALISIPGIEQIVPDGAGRVWILSKTALRVYDDQGKLGTSVSRAQLGIGGAKNTLRADPRDASLWLADDARLLHVNEKGKLLGSRALSDAALDLAILPDQSIWVLGENFLWHFAPGDNEIELVETISLAELQLEQGPRFLLHDPLRNRLWIGSGKTLHRLQQPTNISSKLFKLAQEARGAVFDPKADRIWILHADSLTGYSGSSASVETVDLNLYGIRDAQNLAYDSSAGTLWLRHAGGISSLNRQTGVALNIAHTRSATLMVPAPLAIRPAIALVEPQAEAQITTRNETFVLRMDGRCYGSVCAPLSYGKRFMLDSTLQDRDIGGEFKFDATTGLASYTAPNLPEGKLSFGAQAKDTYGQQSNRIAAYFTARNTAAQPAVAADVSSNDGTAGFIRMGEGLPASAKRREIVYGHAASANGIAEARARQNFLSLPLQFTLNQGQFEPGVKFASRGLGYSLKLSADRATLDLASRKNPLFKKDVKRKAKSALRSDERENMEDADASSIKPLLIRYAGANSNAKISGLDELPGRSNFFRGKDRKAWRTDVPNYERVKYENVYPGIDKIYYGNQSLIEYDWVVAPGADPALIRQVFEGVDSLDIDANGDLLAATAAGVVRQKKPYAYQDQGGIRTEIQAEYYLAKNGEVLFRLGAYDKRKALIIDPVLYGYTKELGGIGWDNIAGLKVDKDGNTYVAATMEVTPGVDDDIVIYKINAAGNAILYTVTIGGTKWEQAAGLAVNGSGEVYVAGSSNSLDFPTEKGIQTILWNDFDAVMARLNAGGNDLVWSTYYGGSGADYATGIALDNIGAPYISGWTNSRDFPRRSPVPTAYSSGVEGFVVKLTVGGLRVYGGYVGGYGDDYLTSIAVDPSGHVHVAGYTNTWDMRLNWPYQYKGGVDAFYGRLNIVQGVWLYYGALGGDGDDRAYDVQVDSGGDAYIVGQTDSENFPVLEAYQPNRRGPSDGFITKVNTSGVVVYSTYIGGEDRDAITAVAVDINRQPHIAGYSLSPDFPGIRMERRPEDTAVVAKLNAVGNAYIYAGSLSFMAGADAIAVDKAGNTYVAGAAGVMPGYPSGGESVFLAKLLPPNDAIALTSSRNPAVEGRPVTFIATVGGNKPNGPVTFKNGSNTLGIAAVSGGVASFTTSALPQGTHAISARFSGDARNAAQTSGVLSQVVMAPGVPMVTITAPANDAAFMQDQAVPYTVSVALPTGRTLRSLVLRVNGIAQTPLINPAGPVIVGQLSGLGMGNHTVIARVQDSLGDVAESASVQIKIVPGPTVSITAPVNGAVFTAPAALMLKADAQANMPGRTVAKVDFYQGTTLIGTDNTAPYEVPWTGVAAGQYTLTAKLTDSAGTTAVSAPVSITVNAFGGPKIVYLHVDFAGSPVAATGSSGQLLWKEHYRPFGIRQKNDASADDQHQWFHGKEEDQTGLMYFGARYYSANLGRFMGMDSVGVDPANIHSFNRYAYGNNNPYKYLDPDGNTPETLADIFTVAMDAGGLIASAGLYGYGKLTGDAALTEVSVQGMRDTAVDTGMSLAAAAAPAIPAIAVKAGVKTARELRKQYVNAVERLAGRVSGMRQSGMSTEEIARALHAERNALKVKFREGSPADDVRRFEARNIEKYGDALGPSVDQLRASGKTWDDIIESSSRPGGSDLGL